MALPSDMNTENDIKESCVVRQTKAEDLHSAVAGLDEVFRQLENLKDSIGIQCDPVCETNGEKDPQPTLSSELAYTPNHIRDCCENMCIKIQQIREALI